MRTIAVLSCTAGKLDHPAPAKDLYRSQLFAKARHVAERQDAWWILSAKHLILSPNETVEPYDHSMRDQTARERRETRRAMAWHLLHPRTHPGDQVLVLCGADYFDDVSEQMLTSAGRNVIRPLKGLGIGFQLHQLDQLASIDVFTVKTEVGAIGQDRSRFRLRNDIHDA